MKACPPAAAVRRFFSEAFAFLLEALKEMFPNPTGRLADVEEVGDLVAFVASERASYINATNLRIDGGASDLAV